MKTKISLTLFREYLAYAITLGLVVGFLMSRSLYSFGLLFMGLFWVTDFQKSAFLWKNKWFLTYILLALMVPIADLLNGIPIDNVFFIKLSMPLFPLFFFTFKPSKSQLTTISFLVIIPLLIASFFALFDYYLQYDSKNELYKVAKVMSIGFYSDHIRISVVIALSCIVAWYEATHSSSWWRFCFIFYILFQVVFLHILVARTGLVVLYVSFIVLFLFQIIKEHKKWLTIALLALFSLPVLSFIFIPSFSNRMGFMRYDFSYYNRMEYRTGSSDGFRYYSVLAGIDIFKQNQWTGVGFKSLRSSTSQWLYQHFPEIKEEEIIQPSSEFVLYAAAGGIVSFIILFLFVIFPFFDPKLRNNLFFNAIFIGILATFFFEIFLENQFGMFVVAFFISWAWWISYTEEKKRKTEGKYITNQDI